MSDKYPELINDSERTGKPMELFWNWFSLNIVIMGLVYGGTIVSFGLSFIQSLVAAFFGAASFLLIGYLSLPGKKGGAVTFILSRAPFGKKGNIIPAILCWICLVGWLAVNVSTGTFSLNTLIGAFGVNITDNITIINLILLVLFILGFSVVKQEILVKAQTIFSYIFGALTVIILCVLIPQTDWSVLFAMENGSWLGGVLPAISIIVAGSALSWAMVASDYSVYQNPKTTSDKQIFWYTSIGASVPLFVLMTLGILMTSGAPDVMASEDPIAGLAAQMPSWMVIPYFFTALGSIIPPAVISLRSARLSLDAMNVRISDRTSIIAHGIIMIVLPIYVIFINGDFLGSFYMFLGYVGICLAAWASIFMADYIVLRKNQGYAVEQIVGNTVNNGVNWVTAGIWFISVVVGFLFTNTPWFNGPFAKGIFQDNSLGVLLTFAVGFIAYFIYAKTQVGKQV